MVYQTAFLEIVNAIQCRIAERKGDSEKYQSFYVGKTPDYAQLWEEHHNENKFEDENLPDARYFNEMYKLAKGTPETINQLEKDVIEYFKTNTKLFNVNEAVEDNPHANVLYVLFHMEFVGVEEIAINSIGNDDCQIAEGFPLNLIDSDVQLKLYD